MSDYEEMLAVFKSGFRARFDAPEMLKPEGDDAIRAGIRAVVDAMYKGMSEPSGLAKLLRDPALIVTREECASAIEALQSEVERLREVLKNIAHFEPDRNSWSVKQARAALEAKP